MIKSVLSMLALLTVLAIACNKQETAPAPEAQPAVESNTQEAHEAVEAAPSQESEGSEQSE